MGSSLPIGTFATRLSAQALSSWFGIYLVVPGNDAYLAHLNFMHIPQLNPFSYAIPIHPPSRLILGVNGLLWLISEPVSSEIYMAFGLP